MAGEALAIEAMLELAAAAFKHKLWKRPRLTTVLLHHRNHQMRVSFSALLRLKDPATDSYVFVHNLHRPQTFGPFGGVYKRAPGSEKALAELEFESEDLGPGDEMHNDLRGYLPRKHLLSLIHWFEKGKGRETPEQCLRRELREELKEIGSRIKVPDPLYLHFVHSVIEGPIKLRNKNNMAQVRIFEVYELADAKRFQGSLVRLAQNSDKLTLANAEQIRHGRSRDNKILGQHCCYLVQRKSTYSDGPGMVDFRSTTAEIASTPARGR
jgi:hypothetical protein